ncbi:rod shape-determining protein MreC [Caldimonas tepidiphila]|uniref:rod shape-determining protein MreC n=1 Tax=Caldimonas tepidiphila TaxID=2315841 RepID=UPI000E5AB325|nr:rod shape-determining protein MreC [Caldimonas tepidiphila]
MPLGTLDRTPPPFFKQGPSALTRLMFFAALAFFLMVADARLHVTDPLRAAVSLVLHPLQQTLLVPVVAVRNGLSYLEGLDAARAAEAAALQRLAEQSARAARTEQLAQENAQLRALLGLRPAVRTESQVAEVLYDVPDPYTRRVLIDRGSQHEVQPGSPVIDDTGVLGQVTRVFPLSSEVTLLTDKDAAIPVLNTRTQVRGAAYGAAGGGGLMELRFVAASADVQQGDLLSTSGVDGVYPPGLGVARVLKVERRADSAFAKVLLTPLGNPDKARHVLVLHPVGMQLPPPEPAPAAAAGAKGAQR